MRIGVGLRKEGGWGAGGGCRRFKEDFKGSCKKIRRWK